MKELFSAIVRMSGEASAVIALVLLVRLLLRRAPKVFSYALWAVVLFRLLCPFAIESVWSLVPSVRMVPADGREASTVQIVQISTGFTEVDRRVNTFFAQYPNQVPEEPIASQNREPSAAGKPEADWRTVVSAVWLAGMVVLLARGIFEVLQLRRRLKGAVKMKGEKDVYLAGCIPAPFVLGIFQPKIYLPDYLHPEEQSYILLHERTHIRRFDHIFRILAWIATTIHWFNPLVWLAFRMAGTDMEMSCDEAVLRRMGRDIRADYSMSLLLLSAGEPLPVTPLGFGELDPKSRIQNVLHYKKPALWVVGLALLAVLTTGAALGTDRTPPPMLYATSGSTEPDPGAPTLPAETVPEPVPEIPPEAETLPFDQTLELHFCSGAGGWSTELLLNPDGSFEGVHHDSDMGDIDTDYPNGTLYICRFHGSFGQIHQVSNASWSLRLEELTLDTGHPIGEEWIEDGVHYISVHPYGLDNANRALTDFLFYTPEATGHAPGTELYGLYETEFWSWWPFRHAFSNADDTLGCYGLRSLETEYGFFSWDEITDG